MVYSHKLLSKWGARIDIMNLICNCVPIIELMVPETVEIVKNVLEYLPRYGALGTRKIPRHLGFPGLCASI